MRHRVEKRPLGRTSSHREALLRNLVTSLIDHGRITTTVPKAKELRRVADRMVTLGKRGDLAARRRALRVIRSAATVKKLFTEVALRSETRPGGYTRILHLGVRPGDGAEMAIIELVDRPVEAVEDSKGKKATAKKPGKPSKADKAAKSAKPAPKKPAPERSKSAPKGPAGVKKTSGTRKIGPE